MSWYSESSVPTHLHLSKVGTPLPLPLGYGGPQAIELATEVDPKLAPIIHFLTGQLFTSSRNTQNNQRNPLTSWTNPKKRIFYEYETKSCLRRPNHVNADFWMWE